MSEDSSKAGTSKQPKDSTQSDAYNTADLPQKKPIGSWRPVESVITTFVLYFVVQFGAGLLLFFALLMLGWNGDRAEQWLTDSVPAQFLYILIAEAFTIAAVYWLLKRRNIAFSGIGWNKPKWQYIGTALAGFGVYFVSYIVVASLASAFVPQLDFEQKQEIGFNTVTSNLDLVLTGISLVVLPPLAEEILFRGFLFGGLRSKLRFLPAAIITSIVFGAGHLQFGSDAPLLWVAALDTFVLSMVLSYVREKTGSLWPGIFIHATKNAIAFSVLFLFTS